MKRYRKVMGLAIVLVALAVAINALAFKTATVTNHASFTVNATKAAALAIQDTTGSERGTGFGTTGVDNGYLTLTINDQMQPNSKYLFKGVFKIVHNLEAANTASITGVKYEVSSVPTPFVAADIKLYKTGTTTEVTNETIADGGSLIVDLEINVPDSITVSDTATGNPYSFDIDIIGNQ